MAGCFKVTFRRRKKKEIGTQTGWETVEVGSQAGGDNVTAEVGNPGLGYWETTEADTQADWSDIIFLGMGSQKGLDVEHGHMLPFRTQEVQNTCQTVGFEHSEWFSCGLRWVEVKLSCMEKLDGSLKKQWWHLTNTFYMETPEGSRDQYASAKFVTYIQRYCGGIVHVSSHLETEANFRLEMDGVQMVEISTSFQGMTISGDGRVSTKERTKTIIVPAPIFPTPEPAFGPVPDSGPGPDSRPDSGFDDDSTSGHDVPGPAYGHDAPGPAYGHDAPGPAYGHDAASATYGHDAPGPAYGHDAASPAYGHDAPGPAYGHDAASATYGHDAPGPAYGHDAASPAYGHDAPGPVYGHDAASATYGHDAPGPVYGHDAPGPAFGHDTPGPDTDTLGRDSNLLPEAMQVPSLYQLFLPMGLEDFSLRLNGLRQAFAVLLAEEQYANFITVAGKMILRTMAALNGQDAGAFQQAFDHLVAFVQTPGHAQAIETELLEVQIHSVNLLDVIFEMVFFGELEGTRARLAPRVQGGFLDHLVIMIHAFMPSEVWPLQAIQCWELLRADVLDFLMEVFSLERSVYSRPQDLSHGLFCCLEQRVDQLLSRMTAT